MLGPSGGVFLQAAEQVQGAHELLPLAERAPERHQPVQHGGVARVALEGLLEHRDRAHRHMRVLLPEVCGLEEARLPLPGILGDARETVGAVRRAPPVVAVTEGLRQGRERVTVAPVVRQREAQHLDAAVRVARRQAHLAEPDQRLG